MTWNLARPAPPVPLNAAEIGAGRSFDWTEFDLAELKAIKNAAGGTVNDVSLAVAAGALRGWLGERGVASDGLELKALVPVSIRTEDEHGELGNKLTAMRGPLPVGVADPVERLRTVSAAMDGLKDSKQPLGAEAIWGLNDWFRDFAPLLLGPTAAINFSTRLFNLLVTNFPGPQVPFYVLGRELTGDPPGRLPRPPPRAGDRDPQLQRPGQLRRPRRPRVAARRRAPRRPPRGRLRRAARGRARRRRADTLWRRWRRAGRR